MTTVPPSDPLFQLIEARDQEGFVSAVVDRASNEGFHVAAALLSEIQREVGRRWQTEEWTVADEHAATALVDRALATIAYESRAEQRHAGQVVVTCGEDEWHVLPGRMLAEQLRHDGWDTVFLGGSLPGTHLERYLERNRPVAVAVSCSVAIQLGGARRTIAACHAAGAPAIVGGAGFGQDDVRATALGADAWAPDADHASAVLTTWAERPPHLASPSVDDRLPQALADRREATVESAMITLARRFPPMLEFSKGQVARTREDFDYILRFVEAALLTADDSIVLEFADWLSSVLTSRGLPETIVAMSFEILEGELPADFAEAKRILRLVSEPAE